MRIAYFTNQYPATSHTFIRREIHALEARGHLTFRYALRHGQGLVDSVDLSEQAATHSVLSLRASGLLSVAFRSFLSRPMAALRALRATLRYASVSRRGLLVHLAYLAEALIIAAWCRRDRVEHLHVHFGTNPATVGVLVKELTGIPFSFTLHGPEEFDRPEEHDLRSKVAASSFVATVSSFGRSQLMRWAAFEDWDKIKVIHCGLDGAYLDETSQSQVAGAALLCVARLSEQKGHLVLIEAAAMLRARGADFRLRIVGDGPLRQTIEVRIGELGLSRHVQILGSLSQAGIREEIRACRVMVLPSFAEGLPVVLMESMALRKPVVSTFVAGIPELVRPDNGWLVPAGDSAALCDAMQTALDTDRATLARMGELARDRVLARHDVGASACLLEKHMLHSARPNAAVQRLRIDASQISGAETMPDEICKEMRGRSARPAAE